MLNYFFKIIFFINFDTFAKLHKEKGFKEEVLFLAIGILDRFLDKIGHWNFPRNKMCSLATISVLIAAKVEEAVSPSI